MENKKVITKSQIKELIRQNKEMRRILESWPAREVMMDYEKSWNEIRKEFLEENDFPLEWGNGKQ